MRDFMPSLSALEAFDAVARLRSFTLAGHELGLTQAAVSARIKSLETLIGAQLVARTSRSVELTDLGDSYIRRVRDVLRQLREATSIAQGEERSCVKILAAQAFAALWLISRLGRFRANYPDVDVILESWTGGFENISVKAFAHHNIDATIVYASSPVLKRGLNCSPLFDDYAVAVCDPKLIASNRLRRPEDLKHQTLLHAINWKGIWDQWLAATGVGRLEVRSELYFQDTAMAVQAAMNGLGVAIAHGPLVEGHIAAGQLCAPFDLRLPVPDRYYFIYPENSANAKALQKFSRWMMQESARLPFAAEYDS